MSVLSIAKSALADHSETFDDMKSEIRMHRDMLEGIVRAFMTGSSAETITMEDVERCGNLAAAKAHLDMAHTALVLATTFKTKR